MALDGDSVETAGIEPAQGSLRKQHSLYRCYDSLGRLLYVGITNAGPGRWTKHGHESSWWPATCRIDLEHYATREDARAAERTLIHDLQPIHNYQHATYAVHSECGARMRWIDLDTPQSAFVFDDRRYQGAWLCKRCFDYDPYVAPPLSAALPGTPDELAPAYGDTAAALARIRSAVEA